MFSIDLAEQQKRVMVIAGMLNAIILLMPHYQYKFMLIIVEGACHLDRN